MTQYTWKQSAPEPAVAAQIFGEELERIQDKHPLKLLDPEQVWRSARHRKSPIHAAWNWNVKEAAEAHWLERARKLIGLCVPVRVQINPGPTTSTRGWYSVKIDHQRGYASEQQILSDQDLKLQVIAAAKAELLTFISKYHAILNDFGRIIPDLQRIIIAMEAEISDLQRRAA
jgi:hypothetical protein